MAFFLPMIGHRIYDALKPEVVEATTPYKQAHNSIPYLFVDGQQQYSTTYWSSLLAGSHVTYQHCQVVSLTWAKALASPLSHEFVQFIVEDTRSGTRTRVFSDRTDQKEPDRIIVGRDWSSSKNPSDQQDLPMPLKSLTFTRKRPTVAKLAKLLAAVTARAPEYHLYSTMCWWYAQSVFDSAKAQFGGDVKEWAFAEYACKMVVWDYVVTPRAQMEEDAKKFRKQNVEGMSFQRPANMKEELAPEDYLEKVAEMFNDEGKRKEYEEAMRIDDSEQVDVQLLKKAIQDIEKSTPSLLAQTKEYEQASSQFTKTILNEPEKTKNMEAFEVAWQRNMREERNVPDDDERMFVRQREFHVGPEQKQKMGFDEAMQCFVGGVLRLMSEDEEVAGEEMAGTP